MAARLRRLAQGVSLNDVHDRMMHHAGELEAEAAQLERQAATEDTPPAGQPAQQVQQEQVQQQQQHEGEAKPGGPRDSGHKPKT